MVRRLLEPFIELPVDRAVTERAGRLRRTSDVRLPDALIAATAAEHRLVLVTRDVRHFPGVRGLRVLSRRAASELRTLCDCPRNERATSEHEF